MIWAYTTAWGTKDTCTFLVRIPRKGTPTRYPPAFIRISKKTEVEQGNFPFLSGSWFLCAFRNRFYFNFSTDHQIVSYSDGCPGQNQNQTLFLFLAHVQRSGMYAINTW